MVGGEVQAGGGGSVRGVRRGWRYAERGQGGRGLHVAVQCAAARRPVWLLGKKPELWCERYVKKNRKKSWGGDTCPLPSALLMNAASVPIFEALMATGWRGAALRAEVTCSPCDHESQDSGRGEGGWGRFGRGVGGGGQGEGGGTSWEPRKAVLVPQAV